MRDLRYALRIFARTPLFTAIVVLTLALGMGANTAIFSIVEAVLLRPLPYRDPQRMVAVWNSDAQQPGSKLFATYRDFQHWRDHSTSFEQLAGATWTRADRYLTGRGPARGVTAIQATRELFSLLGAAPALGRAFIPEDFSRPCTVVLAHGFWQTQLAADPGILGQSLRLDDDSCQVIGVMPAGFFFFPAAADVWVLVTPSSPLERNPDRFGIGVFGRLKPGVSIAAAESEVTALARQIENGVRFGAQMHPVVYELRSEFTWLAGRNLRLSLLVLFAAVSFVLLIACVNVAGLLLSRAFSRHREMIIRAALGGSRARLIGQLLTENLVLSGGAAILGMGIAATAIRVFQIYNPVELPPGAGVRFNAAVFAFTAALSLLTTLVFGFIPAWRTTRPKPSHGQRLAKGLIAAEMTLSLVLLAGAGLLIESVARFASAPLGFDSARLSAVSLSFPPKGYEQPERRLRVFDGLAPAMPAVEGWALSTGVPLGGGNGVDVLTRQDRPVPDPRTAVHDIQQQAITPGYFRLLEMRVLKGREFSDADREDTMPVAIVNEELARKYFPGEDPLGRHVRALGFPGTANPWLTIVGVAANEKRSTLYQEMNWVDTPILYEPLAQQAPARVTLLVRMPEHQPFPASAIQQAVLSIAPDARVGDAQTVEHMRAGYLAYPRFRAALLAAFAGFALLLAAVGLYGVLSQVVAQRTHEIGIRMALGAQRAQVLGMILREALLLAAGGAAVGIAAALYLGSFLRSLLYGVQPQDPLILSGVSAALMLSALLAAYLPARQAARMDPMVSLRHE